MNLDRGFEEVSEHLEIFNKCVCSFFWGIKLYLLPVAVKISWRACKKFVPDRVENSRWRILLLLFHRGRNILLCIYMQKPFRRIQKKLEVVVISGEGNQEAGVKSLTFHYYSFVPFNFIHCPLSSRPLKSEFLNFRWLGHNICVSVFFLIAQCILIIH